MAVLLVGLVLLVQVILAVPLGILDFVVERFLHRPSPQLEREPLLMGGINLVAFGAAIALGLWLNRLPLRRAFRMGGITFLQAVAMSVTLLGIDLLLSEADNVFRALLPMPEWLANFVKDLLFAEGKLVPRIFLLVIVAPLTEELLFRGIILRGLLSRHRPAVAVVLTALLFAALHLNPWQFISPLCLGIAFGWFYFRSGSVGLCVLAHAFSNGLLIAFSLLPLEVPGLVGTPDSTTVAFQPWWVDVSRLVLLPIGLWLFRKATPAIPMPLVEVPPVIGSGDPQRFG
jgi:membrane protease YdiL (CAAX protease family)